MREPDSKGEDGQHHPLKMHRQPVPWTQSEEGEAAGVGDAF